MSKYKEISEKVGSLHNQIVRLEVWLTNYHAQQKVVFNNNGAIKESNSGGPFCPVIKITNANDGFYGDLSFSGYGFTELLEAVAEVLETRKNGLRAELLELQTKLAAIEELLRG